MPVEISIPTALRAYTGGQAQVLVEAPTVGAALQRLTDDNPKLASQLRGPDGRLRSFVNVYLNDEDIRFVDGGEGAAVKAGDSLIIVPSIAGGAA